MIKLCYVTSGKYRKTEKPKTSYLLEKTFFLLFAVSVKMKKKKIFKEEESFEILEIPGLIKTI